MKVVRPNFSTLKISCQSPRLSLRLGQGSAYSLETLFRISRSSFHRWLALQLTQKYVYTSNLSQIINFRQLKLGNVNPTLSGVCMIKTHILESSMAGAGVYEFLLLSLMFSKTCNKALNSCSEDSAASTLPSSILYRGFKKSHSAIKMFKRK